MSGPKAACSRVQEILAPQPRPVQARPVPVPVAKAPQPQEVVLGGKQVPQQVPQPFCCMLVGRCRAFCASQAAA